MDQLSWDAWLSELEMENEYVLKGMNSDQDDDAGECFFRSILQDRTNSFFETETEAILAPASVGDGGATTNSIVTSQQSASKTTPLTSCVLSFGKSIVKPEDITEPSSYNHSYQIKDNVSSYPLKPKRSIEAVYDKPPQVKAVRGTKKSRSSADATSHIMAERRRRQELTERFIALSATIPGVKKIDNSSILSEAISYVKQLQERVKELELETTNKMMVSFADDDNFVDGGTPTMSVENSDGDGCDEGKGTPYNNDDVLLPEVKARISDNKEVLIRILCKNQKSTMLRILDELKSLNLNVVGNSVLPFGSTTLDVTIIAQMTDEEYSVSVEDIAKSLKMALNCNNGDPY